MFETTSSKRNLLGSWPVGVLGALLLLMVVIGRARGYRGDYCVSSGLAMLVVTFFCRRTNASLSQHRLGELLGAQGKAYPIKCATLFFAALVAADFCSFLLEPSDSPKPGKLLWHSYIFELNQNAHIRNVVSNLFLAGLAATVFRKVSNELIAIPVIAAAFAVAERLVAGTWMRELLGLAVHSGGLLAGVALMMRLVKHLWLATFLGALVGASADVLFHVVAYRSNLSFSYFAGRLIFGLVFGIGLQLLVKPDGAETGDSQVAVGGPQS